MRLNKFSTKCKAALHVVFSSFSLLHAQTGLYVGSFDPPTKAHLDIIQRASTICDTLYISIGCNPTKTQPFLPIEIRASLLEEVTRELPNVKIDFFTGLTIDYAKKKGIDFLIRGLRSYQDFESEYAISTANREMSGIDTLFFLSKAEYRHISSSLVREIYKFQGDLSPFVPEEVLQFLYTNEFKSFVYKSIEDRL